MSAPDRRNDRPVDRRGAARGGRRPTDRPGKAPFVLLADSHDVARSVYARYLDRFYFHTEVAGTPHEVGASVDRTRPAAVLIEPDMGGVPAWEIASWPGLRGVPCIVLAGGSGYDLSANGGFTPAAVLQKPFELSTMLYELRRVLRTSPAPSV